jgi:hypothetical protein
LSLRKPKSAGKQSPFGTIFDEPGIEIHSAPKAVHEAECAKTAPFGERALGDTKKGGYAELLRQQTALARFGELALRSDDLEEILTEACRLAGEALRTDLAKETRNSIFPDLGGAPKGVSPGKMPAGEYMGLFINDTGTGRPPDVIAHAFDPFFTTKPTGGHRSRLVDDLRLCPAIRRPRAPEQRKGPGHNGVDLHGSTR